MDSVQYMVSTCFAQRERKLRRSRDWRSLILLQWSRHPAALSVPPSSPRDDNCAAFSRRCNVQLTRKTKPSPLWQLCSRCGWSKWNSTSYIVDLIVTPTIEQPPAPGKELFPFAPLQQQPCRYRNQHHSWWKPSQWIGFLALSAGYTSNRALHSIHFERWGHSRTP